jgi:diguanylate cyclase (GGDEF)-like protein
VQTQQPDISTGLNSAIEWLSSRRTSRLVAAAIGLLSLISAADLVTPSDVALSVGYLMPVFLAATGSRRAGLSIAVLTDFVWTTIDGFHRLKPYSGVIVPYWNAGARLAVLSLIALLVATLTTKLARETGLSRTDSLTGLPNARAFHEAAAAEIHRMRRSGHVLTAAYVDVDNFKSVNDSLGHPAGDALLALTARTMTEALRGTDVVARMGGDEFAVLLPGANLADAMVRLRAVHIALSDAVGQTVPDVGFSIGAVTFDEPPLSGEHLIARADRVMYGVKQHGKNTVWAEPAETESTPHVDHLAGHGRIRSSRDARRRGGDRAETR